jgi:DNA-binding LacI/PurR family transcriptional regulator
MRPVLAVITNNPNEVFQRNVILGIGETSQARGYEMALITVPDRRAPAAPLDGLAGLLVIANPVPDSFLRQMYERGLPISLVSHRVEGLPIPAVAPNNTQGIALLVEHLVVHCKRRKLVFIQGDMEQNDGIQRDAAFRQEVMRHNLHLPPEFFLRGDFIPSVAAAALAQLTVLTHDFDGIVASDYLMALAAIEVLNQQGLRVPQDAAVVGFGSGPEADAAGLTNVAADVQELGRRAARQLIGQVEGLRIRGLTLLSAELVERSTSCRAAARP